MAGDTNDDDKIAKIAQKLIKKGDTADVAVEALADQLRANVLSTVSKYQEKYGPGKPQNTLSSRDQLNDHDHSISKLKEEHETARTAWKNFAEAENQPKWDGRTADPTEDSKSVKQLKKMGLGTDELAAVADLMRQYSDLNKDGISKSPQVATGHTVKNPTGAEKTSTTGVTF